MASIQRMLKELMIESDKLIQTEAKAPPREKEWFVMIKEVAQRIADGRLPEQFHPTGESSNDSPTMIPSCLTFIKGKTEMYATRVSAYFPQNERDHVHKKKRNTLKSEKELSVSVNSRTTPRSSRTSSAKSKENSQQRVRNDSECMIIEEDKPASGSDRTFIKTATPSEFVTPVQKDKRSPPSSLRGKRKSSGTVTKIRSLEQEIFQKKLKTISVSHEPHLVIRSSRFSMGKKKHSGLRDTHQPSALASRCSSKASIKGKRDTMQCKEDAAAENLKKIKDARRKKIEESKKIRDEKMERTREKRMKMEKAKTLSAKQKTSETVTRSTRAQERNTETRARSREPKEKIDPTTVVKPSRANSKKTTQSESEIPTLRSASKSKGTTTLSKTPKETPSSKSKEPTSMPKETPASSKSTLPSSKPPIPEDTPDSSKNSEPSSPVLRTPASVKGRRPTPPLKAQPLKVTPSPTIVTLQNTTVVIDKETEIKSSPKGSLKRATTPTSPPATKKNVKSQERTATSEEKLNKSSSPQAAKKQKLEKTANAPKAESSEKIKKPDSYELTPDRSSFTSYDMSEIVSDDDEESPSTQKPIPSWAVGLRLRNALLHQYYNPVDTDELFGNVWETPDLEQMFNTKKKAYNKRTSSAVWQSPRAFK